MLNQWKAGGVLVSWEGMKRHLTFGPDLNLLVFLITVPQGSSGKHLEKKSNQKHGTLED